MEAIFTVLFLPALIGIIFIVTAGIVYMFPPRKINYLYGYRTSASMKSQQHWDFAQRYSSIKMFQVGIALLVISLLGLILPITEEQNLIIGLCLSLPSCIVMFFMTERALRKQFPN